MKEKRTRRVYYLGDDDLTPVEGGEVHMSAQRVADSLRSGTCPRDRLFDRFLPYHLRLATHVHWTPLIVAQRVAEWIDELSVKTVVDIGSGSGKFCVATAIASSCVLTGVEQRGNLVEAARDLAQTFGVADRVHFVQGVVGTCTIPDADAYYLFNPFGENLFGADKHLGSDIELSDTRYDHDVRFMETFFDRLRVGTYIFKYNGFGGRMPPDYEVVRVDREMPNLLRAWQKKAPKSSLASRSERL